MNQFNTKRIAFSWLLSWLIMGSYCYSQSPQFNSVPTLNNQNSPVVPINIPVVTTRSMNIFYQVDLPPEQLSHVELWYAQGFNSPWLLYDYDQDKLSPVQFTASGEGIYRFLIVAVDRNGQFSYQQNGQRTQVGMIPNTVTPHQIVFVDFNKPQLYLQRPKAAMSVMENGAMPITWAGFDLHLDQTPVNLFFMEQQNPSAGWQVLASNQPAIGQYQWRIPQGVSSPVKLKISISDQAFQKESIETAWLEFQSNGTPVLNTVNTVKPQESKANPTDLTAPSAEKDNVSPILSETKPLITDVPEKTNSDEIDIKLVNSSSKPKNKEIKIQETASSFYRRGIIYSQRFEWEQAVASFRKAINADPDYEQARLRLAECYYKMNDYVQAEKEFNVALKINPIQPTALFGLAQTAFAQKNYQLCKSTLDTLLGINPKDWQAWLMHGDAARFLGLNDEAKRSWQKAAESNLPFIVKAAKERMSM